jgi:sterol desaturase/sphingolipid hydroxylase (fatty acid hydroxylase superfamily)
MVYWLHEAGVWWASLELNTLRYAVFAAFTWVLLWFVLKVPLRGRKIRAQTPPVRQLAMEFLVSLRSIAAFATAAVAMSALFRLGAYPLSHLAHEWGPIWFWTSLALMILGHDAYYYWTHWAMHRYAPLRSLHHRHHRSHNPSPFTAYSFSVGEAGLMAAFVVLWPLVAPTPWPVITLFILHQIARNTLAHSGYELMPATRDGRPVFDWLTTTTHHDLHHARPGSNFGLYFTWWDRWMGTENPGYHAAFADAVRKPVVAAAALVDLEPVTA